MRCSYWNKWIFKVKCSHFQNKIFDFFVLEKNKTDVYWNNIWQNDFALNLVHNLNKKKYNEYEIKETIEIIWLIMKRIMTVC